VGRRGQASQLLALGVARDGAKRGLDVIMAALLLVILALPIVVLAFVIRLDSPGPSFYRCRRVGRRGREFWMLKFRKMHDGATGPALTAPGDERLTRLGRFLADTKLDELPQLWNVLKGEMSLVGPRPEDPGFVADQAVAYEEVLEVRPGITGLTQLAFARESRLLGGEDHCEFYVEDLLPKKIGIDQLYVRRRSMAMDLRILFWTGCAVLMGISVAVNRKSGRLSVRRRPDPSVAPQKAWEEPA
jgi:lipopolysaccharide/colanic/teichoic acid biosynthesis glycosyltransferase